MTAPRRNNNSLYILDIETTGLSAMDHQIVCIGLCNVETGKIKIFYEKGEQEMLHDFWQWHHDNDPYYYGYNLRNFDVHFIRIRSLIHRVPVQSMSYQDLMLILTPPPMRYKRMSDWCKVLNIPIEDEFKGSDVPNLFYKGQMDKIIEHVRKDIMREREIFLLLEQGGFI